MSDEPKTGFRGWFSSRSADAGEEGGGGGGLGQLFKDLTSRIGTRKTAQELVELFRTWLVELPVEKKAFLDGKLQNDLDGVTTWLAELTPDEAKIFYKQLSAFCANLNFELAWLVDPQTDNDPTIETALEQAVMLYCLAQWKAEQVQDDIEEFLLFKAWVHDPADDDYEDLNQKVFAKLLEKGLASNPPAELFMASAEERQAHFVGIIQEVIEKDQQGLYAIVKEVLH